MPHNKKITDPSITRPAISPSNHSRFTKMAAATLAAGCLIYFWPDRLIVDARMMYYWPDSLIDNARTEIRLMGNDANALKKAIEQELRLASESNDIDAFLFHLDNQFRMERKLLTSSSGYNFASLYKMGFFYKPNVSDASGEHGAVVYPMGNLPAEISSILMRSGYFEWVNKNANQVISVGQIKKYPDIFDNGNSQATADIYSKSILIEDIRKRNPLLVAGLIVHEAFHLEKNESYKDVYSAEQDAYKKELDFYDRCSTLQDIPEETRRAAINSTKRSMARAFEGRK